MYQGEATNGTLGKRSQTNCRDGRCGGCARCLAEEWPDEMEGYYDETQEER